MKTIKKMKKIVNQKVSMIIILSLIIVLSGCSDVIEKDITNKQVTVNSPANGAKSVIYNQLFWWNLLDGATDYSIQIVTPSFDSLVSFVVDTIVTGDKFNQVLAPGKYQWRIRGENGAYQTNYQTYNLVMNVSSLNLQTINIVSPANNTYQNSTTGGGLFNFQWDVLPGATKYLIEIDTVSQNFVTPILTDSTSNAYYSYSFAQQGDYKWRVMAKDNSGNQTVWTDPYYTGYYTTAPATPIPVAPATKTTVAPTTVTFSWDAVTRAKTYTLYLYRNGADTTVTSSESYSVSSPSTSVSLAGATSGAIIYWRISATDKANNQSALSFPTMRITIQ
jgi:hypothetical protein